jgi:hypothetical protein
LILRQQHGLRHSYGRRYKPLYGELLEFLKAEDPFPTVLVKGKLLPHLYSIDADDILRDIRHADSPASIAQAIHDRLERVATEMPLARGASIPLEEHYLGIAGRLWDILQSERESAGLP